ncbi:hypothetical protein WEN_00665 [Mycoplasma wenyonii str. Massachusetts]|uniref:Uncharacterized protein n=1 Tax=Mycoplasma wenyonii (strain Massachusetts) TaxID=1197325 RepID=I6Z5U4_MYCWM|nr:hypothetical protein [Mycoplasma wenyonii]AFN64938.1 hypothetical protein WEN_00665 [Mycoplasma wenyonii str. Massachusetts]
MSAITRIAQIFSVFGVGASVPLTTVFAKDRLKRITFLRQAGGDTRVVEIQKEQTAMEKATQQLNEAHGSSGEMKWGCFWYPDFQGLELFFCFDQNNPKSPTLFHWKGPKDKTVSWVQSIEKPTTLHFKEGGSQKPINRKLQSLLSWTQKWSNENPFKPSEHCIINRHKVKDYQLICNNPSPEQAKIKNPAWTRDISGNLVVEPGVSLKNKPT